MEHHYTPIVIGNGGLRGRLLTLPSDVANSQALLRIELADGRQIEVPRDALTEQADGSYRIAVGPQDIAAAQSAAMAERACPEPEAVVPVYEETLTVGKRLVETGRTVIRKHVETHAQVVDEPLLRQEVRVERVPIDRIIEGPAPQQRYEGETLVVPVLEEVLVVEKRLRLREELHISRVQQTVHEPQTVELRTENVTVERAVAPAVEQPGDAARL